MTHYFKDYTALVERIAQSGREGLERFDPDALSALAGDERQEAEALLVAELRSGSADPRVIRALADLGSKQAVPLLKQAATRPDQSGVAAALAIWELAKDEAAGPDLANILQHAADPSARLLAAAELAHFPSPGTDSVLLAALDDEDELVRGQATGSLLGLCGLERAAAVARGHLFRLTALILNPLHAVREPAIRELAGLVAAVRGGKDPGELGLAVEEVPESAALDQFAESAFIEPDPDNPDAPWQTDLDLLSLDKLQGEERQWAQHLIYLVLSKGDARAVRAILHVGDKSAVPALQEVTQTHEGEVADAARAALKTLS